LKQMGVPVIKKLRKKHLNKIIEWVDTDFNVTVDYRDTTAEAVARAVALGKK
jgi:hypothetical protein